MYRLRAWAPVSGPGTRSQNAGVWGAVCSAAASVPLSQPQWREREGDDVIVESFDAHPWGEPNPL